MGLGLLGGRDLSISSERAPGETTALHAEQTILQASEDRVI